MNERAGTQRDAATIALGGSIAFVGRICTMGLSYVLALILARGLGASDYGLYVVGFSLVNLIGSLALLGLNRGAVRFIAMYRGIEDHSRVKGTIWVAVGLVLLTGILAAVLVTLFAEPLMRLLRAPAAFRHYLADLRWWIPVWALTLTVAATVEALKRLDIRTAIVDMGAPLLRVLFTGAALLVGARLSGVVWANVAASLIALLAIGASAYRLFRPQLKGVPALLPVRELLAFSLPVMLFNLLSLSQNQVEVYLLTAMQSSEATGVFNIASRTSVLIVAFLEGLGYIFSPFISDLSNRQEMSQLQELVSTVTRWSFMIGLPIALTLILFNGPILRIFGTSFEQAVPALIVLSLGQLINAATGPVGIILTMSGHPKVNLIDSILTLILNVVLDVLLIPRLGIMGAAIGSSIAIGLVNILRTIQVYWILHIWAYDWRFLKPVAAAAVAGGATYLLISRGLGSEWLTFGVGLALFGVVYAGGILLLGLSESDMLVLRSLKARVRGN
jgi:O-antigen/teichoic acid export membrane protein